jgi:pimeloyl-ACP methyl ester carboxylesterase
MPGQLIDVGGYRLHLHCTSSGSPTVVLEPGAGEMSSNLGWITPGVARGTRVCVYDRAGRGWSQPADTTQDGTQIATDRIGQFDPHAQRRRSSSSTCIRSQNAPIMESHCGRPQLMTVRGGRRGYSVGAAGSGSDQ